MDPLSITASIIGIVGLADKCVTKLRVLGQASTEVILLVNEVSDLNSVLTQLIVLNHQTQQVENPAAEGSQIALKSLLKRAEDQLVELHQIVQKDLIKTGSKRPKANPLGWARNKDHVTQLQQSIRSTRLNLAIAVGTANSQALTRVELAIQSISTSQLFDNHLLHRILEQISQEASRCNPEPSQNKILFPRSSLAKFKSNNADSVDCHGPSPRALRGSTGIQGGFDIKARARTISVSCDRWCSCACHVRGTFRYPEWMRSVLGSLFVGYTGMPVFTPSCSETNCKQRSAPSVEVTYRFPSWFLSRVVSLNLRLSPVAGPELCLRMPRMMDWSTPLWQASEVGDISAIQVLFGSGGASPFDVNPYGQSALHYAANKGRVDLCYFLIQQNADIYARDENGSRPLDYAWDRILSKDVDEETSSALSTIFSDSEHLEARQFSTLHKALLGLASSSLTVQLQLSTAHINSMDGNGRTCLSWAAARGDVVATQVLLEHGANPDITDMEGFPPLFHAIRSRSKECISLLLKYSTKHQAVNVYGCTALHVASICSDPDIMALLIEQCRVSVNAIDYDGDTALNAVARTKLAAAARHLLDAGADASIANVTGDTPLHMAVYWMSLEVLEELVRSGADFNVLNVKGETPLHTVARDCDPEVLGILKGAPSVLNVDLYAKNRDGVSCLDCVSDNEEKRRLFEDFLEQIRRSGERRGEEDDEVYEDAPEY